MGPLLSILAVLFYGVLHSLLASTSAKVQAQQTLGQGVMRLYRLLFNIIGLLTFIPVLAVPLLIPGEILYQLTGIWRVFSMIGQILAVIFLVMGLMQTDPWHFLGVKQLLDGFSDGDQKLVVGGLYRCVRHPLYAAGLVFIWLTPVMTSSVLTLILGLTLYIIVGSIFEERRLQGKFGSAYTAYKRKVPRLIPRLSKCIGDE